MARIWLITGASSGLGRALLETVLEAGELVAASVRDPRALDDLVVRHGDRLEVLAFDVRDRGDAERGVANAVARFGGLDVVVNNAGYALVGAVEEIADDELRDQLDVNLFAVATVLRAALPHLRDRGGGHVVNVSSIGGLVATAGAGAYHASKFALEGLSESLAQELLPLGIRVTLVEPGGLRTDFAGRSARYARTRIEAYSQTAGLVRDRLSALDGRQPGDPARAAAAILAAVEAGEAAPLRLVLGEDAAAMLGSKLQSLEHALEEGQ